ncbi:MAG: class I SAM-dependent methyltransferase [Ignavibacteriales bacterium]|nr:class I SAM-dependent methyltransferase [Ignavibacteriales bacterium]
MKKLSAFLKGKNIYNAEDAYNLWADTYDQEQNNLMLYYDNIILRDLLSEMELKGKLILDYGCGTGRNWPLFLKSNPKNIIGCDVSSNMLKKLESKYDSAKTYLILDNKLPLMDDNETDIIISTLVIAHIKKIDDMIAEWNRVLKKNSEIIITDFHPAMLAKGGSRTFIHKNRSLTIKNYIHTITEIEKRLSSYGFRTLRLIEKKIEEDVKHFYVEHNALPVYEKFEGTPFIYGLHLSR